MLRYQCSAIIAQIVILSEAKDPYSLHTFAVE